MKRSKYHFTWLIICPLLLTGLSLVLTAQTLAQDRLVVFLVRHAEKVDASRDPKLSASGMERARQLASVLRDANLTHIHSSDFIRTRDTATPIAERLHLEVELYDPQDLPALVSKVQKEGGRHLIIGHSNSTPAVAELLGGKPGTPINEAGEFDRLYIVTVDAAGRAGTVLMRYGRPFKEAAGK